MTSASKPSAAALRYATPVSDALNAINERGLDCAPIRGEDPAPIDNFVLLSRLCEAGRADCKTLCLNLIDRTATYASQRQGQLAPDIAALLSAATHAAIREDIAGVIEHLEVALARLTQPAPTKPPVAATRQSLANLPTKTLAQTVDPLLARLRAKQG